MNLGKVRDGVYIKHIDFNKAVLWKDRQLSVHRKIFDTWEHIYKFKLLRFIDRKKGIIYEVDTKEAMDRSTLKKVGQEHQYYFPIEILKERKLNGSTTKN